MEPPMDKPPEKMTYRSAGLDLDLYEESLAGIAPLVRRTHTPRVLDGFGGFASLFSLDFNTRLFARNYRHPVLVSSSDGVGTKLKVAAMMGKYDTVGIDLVAMSVNDCLCTGGEPLFFLDYVAMPKDDPALLRDLVKGISDGCMEADCSLVGGETAILPDFYAPGDYDMAGFCVGVVERDHIIDGRAVRVGDLVIGLAASGLHSNGYSLARKVVFDRAGLKVDTPVPELNTTAGEALLTPTRIYVRALRSVLSNYPVKRRVVRALAHITGEGLEGNIPRVLPAGKRVALRKGSWTVPPVFGWLQRLGNIDEAEMFRVFNMGIGFVFIVSQYYGDSILRQLNEEGYPATVVGEVRDGEPGVEFIA
jgi:phosphoribosylformylglycinamidine cyclo-ligase